MMLIFLSLLLIFRVDGQVSKQEAIFRKCNSVFKDLKLCGIPFDVKKFNELIDKSVCYNEHFINTVKAMEPHKSIAIGEYAEKFSRKISFMVALLNDSTSPLCSALLDNPASLLSNIVTIFTAQDSLADDVEQRAERLSFFIKQGTIVYNELFHREHLLKEIELEFSTNNYLKWFPFPTHEHPIATSDLFLMRSLGDQACDAYAISRGMHKRMADYIGFMSAFFQIVCPRDEFVLDELLALLSMRNVVYNRLSHLLLFQYDNPLSRWIFENYFKVVQLTGSAFVNAYLDFIFNPSIYKYIFEMIKPFNCKEKLHKLRCWEYPNYFLNETGAKFLLSSTYFQRFLCFLTEQTVPTMALMSKVQIDVSELEMSLSRAFKVNVGNSREILEIFDKLNIFLMNDKFLQKSVDAIGTENHFERLTRSFLRMLQEPNAKLLQASITEALWNSSSFSIKMEKYAMFEEERKQLREVMKKKARFLLKKAQIVDGI